MVFDNNSIPEEIRRDWRLPVYLLAVSMLLLVSFAWNFLPAFQVIEIANPANVTSISGWVAYFGGTAVDVYYPLTFGISAQVLTLISALCALAFSLLLKLRRTDGRRRFSLIVVSLSTNLVAVILLFLSKWQFTDVNQLTILGLTSHYHVGLVLQAMTLLCAGYIQWFFFIKIRHYIK